MNNRKLICQNDLIDTRKKHNPTELKVFYNMLYCYKEQMAYTNPDEEVISMDVSKLANYLGKKHLTENDLIDIIQNVPKGVYSKDGKTYLSAFDYLYYDEEEEAFKFEVEEKFKSYVDDVIKSFTIIELGSLSNLKSTYSQRMFEFVSKNKNIGVYLMPINEFKEYFNIPRSYAMCNIDQRILQPAKRDIDNNTNLTFNYTKVKKKNKVTHIRFTFA